MSTAAELPTVVSEKPQPTTHKRQKQTAESPAAPLEQPADKNDSTITVPMSHVGDGYIPRDVYARGLTSKQSVNLKRLMRGLEDRGARLENGAPVNDRTKAIKWLLEQLG